MTTLPKPPYVYFDSSRARVPGRSFLCSDPVEILTEVDGEYVELNSGNRVSDPAAWLREPTDLILAGFLGYEFGWDLLDVHAAPMPSRSPRLWVGRFRDCAEGDWQPGEPDGVLTEVRCRRNRDSYEDCVRRCVEDIYDGELFEVNFTARFDARWDGTAEAFYDRCRRASTGDWFGLLHTGSTVVASVSPEEFIRVEDGIVTARPIKGTRRRHADPDEDARAARDLEASEKDRAENVMIVDLMRNDLTRVCELGSVEVPQMCAVESFAEVHHLVSTVTGRLRADHRPIDALLRCFPAGSITGAPKLRAMELAAEYEESARGAYTGSLFVAHPDGRLQSNVLIRTATLFETPDGYDVEYGAGGAVVADSDPRSEWEEALAKARPLTRVSDQPVEFE